jgi:transposase
MLMATSSLRVFAHRDPTDMRKSFSGLVGLVETELGQQIESGDLFLFFNRRRDRVKVLYFVGDGLVIFYRMLEQGTFEVPAATDANSNTAGVELRLSDLTLILEGIELASVKRRKRWRREPQPT